MRAIPLLVLLLVLAPNGSVQANYGTTQTKSYIAGNPGTFALHPVPLQDSCTSSQGIGGVLFCNVDAASAFTVNVRISDATGLPTGAYVRFLSASGSLLRERVVCMEETLGVPAGTVRMEVRVAVGPVAGCLHAGTKGTIVAAWNAPPLPSLRTKRYITDGVVPGVGSGDATCGASVGEPHLRFCGLNNPSPTLLTVTVVDDSGLPVAAHVGTGLPLVPVPGGFPPEDICGSATWPVPANINQLLVTPALLSGPMAGCVAAPATKGTVTVALA